MTDDFRYPACQGIFTVLESAAGQVVPCPTCAQSIQLPVQQPISGKAIWASICGVMTLACNLLAAVPAVVLCYLAVRDIRGSKGRVRGFDLVLFASLSAVLGPALNYTLIVRPYRQHARTLQSLSRLKELGLAMHNYHDTYRRFPAFASFGPNREPLLSWRVHLLPFLGEQELYDQFHLDEPWDSSHNRTLIGRMPDVYKNRFFVEPGRTSFVVPLSAEVSREFHLPQTLFPRTGSPITFRRIPDGTANTLMLAEAAADQAVIWTNPADLPFDPRQPRRGLASHATPIALFRKAPGFLAALADGSVLFVSDEFDDETLRSLFLIDDGRFLNTRLDGFALLPE